MRWSSVFSLAAKKKMPTDKVAVIEYKELDPKEEIKRLRHLLEQSVAYIDKYVPDLCGQRGVLSSMIRDALQSKWDEGEWEHLNDD